MSALGPRIYNLFPRLAGPIDKWKDHFERIAGMGFDWIFVNPFHETGASNSLYAVKDYYRLNPDFRGRSRKSDDALIRSFVDAAAKSGLSVMMDLVINHTAQDGRVPEEHPNWFVHNPDGSLAAPFAVDPADTRKKTVWEDLAEIDYSDRQERGEIIRYFSDVVSHYMGLGIQGFRCDAAYKVPSSAWREIIDTAKRTRSDAVFAAESLGALQEQVEALRGGGFDLLFNSSKWWDFQAPWLLDQYEMFRSIAPSVAFPETHDTERLVTDLEGQGGGDSGWVEQEYRRAYMFAAAFSTAVMIPVGYEFGFRKKLHVVATTPDDWETPAFDLTKFIGDVNRMKADAPALNEEGPQHQLHLGDGRVTCLLRRAESGPHWALTLVNTDRGGAHAIRLDGLDGGGSAREITPGANGARFDAGAEVAVEPGAVRVFASA